ncbi:uncharacterized protein LOC143358321 isoform X3 [Halictus rubicundus]|uniref:uncharacterized protein LOC143358321 isoform X3 n=1 Tax=Halictus rubicundus TaxID=77578 RepID=UPI0040355665
MGTESVYLLLLLSTTVIRRDLAWSEAASDCVVPNSKVDRLTRAEPGSESGSGSGTRIASVVEGSDLSAFLEELEGRLSRLERRLRAVEQPVWQMGTTEEDWEVCAEGPCRCQPEIKSVSCWRQDLLDLPAAQLVPRDVLKLDASSNRLRTLPESLFLSTNLLVLLDLTCNRIATLTVGTFRGLTTLEELLLGKNRLSTLPNDLFGDLTNLRFLGLEDNRLKALPDQVFRGQTSLRELNARGNQLAEISGELLVPLKQLRSLEMSSNKITRIHPSAFHGLASLKDLQLGHNRIRNVTPGLFTGSGSLERLVLYANGIERLSRGAFRGLSNLTSLFLHSNHLRILHPELFQDTPNLQKLQLESNYLSSLPARILDPVASIEQLRLARNPWHCDCAASYLATWLQNRYRSRANATTDSSESFAAWEFGAGAVCRGPGTLGGRMLMRLSIYELCEGQWASMRGLTPRLPVDHGSAGNNSSRRGSDKPDEPSA